MRLSKLQKYILERCFRNKKQTPKVLLLGYYPAKKIGLNRKSANDSLRESLETLVAKDLLIAYGRKTAKKSYIDRVKLTSRGRKAAKRIILSKQKKLPKI